MIKFKLLTVNEVDSLEAALNHEKDVLNLPVNNSVTYTLRKHIVDINGERDRSKIEAFIDYMRSMDRKKLMDYIDEIESGIDLEITVGTLGGGSVTTFLPLNFGFFWPDK